MYTNKSLFFVTDLQTTCCAKLKFLATMSNESLWNVSWNAFWTRPVNCQVYTFLENAQLEHESRGCFYGTKLYSDIVVIKGHIAMQAAARILSRYFCNTPLCLLRLRIIYRWALSIDIVNRLRVEKFFNSPFFVTFWHFGGIKGVWNVDFNFYNPQKAHPRFRVFWAIVWQHTFRGLTCRLVKEKT